MNEQGESLLEILDELVEIVSHAKSLPISASVMVNRSELLDLLETAREIVPDQIVAADEVLQEASAVSESARQDAESIRERAEQDAATIVAEAREQASRMVAQDQITIAAKSQATRILDEAQTKADHMVRGADDYAATTLDQLSEELGGLLEQIAAGRAHLAHRLEDES